VRIGVFGGTFDPPHVGHLLLATDAREALELDRVIFVHAPPVASARDRLEMVRLAVADDANYTVDDTEIDRKGLSFTVDTLEHLSRKNPGARLFLLLGEDTLSGMDGWRSPERIRELAQLAVMRRLGSGDAAETAIADGVVSVSARRIDVSSTEIRDRLRAGKSIKGFVPESVEQFIEARGLYR
jgi:nicotinate-nucleotide adenylyltransferase